MRFEGGLLPVEPGQEVVVGRDAAVDLVIDGRRVSRRHCSVRADETGWVVTDLGSANGTYIGGSRITEKRGTTATRVGLGAPEGPGFVVGPAGQAAPDTPSEPGEATLSNRPRHVPTGVTVVGDRRTTAFPAPLSHDTGSGFTNVGLSVTAMHRLADVVRVGRDPRNDIVLEDLMVSRFHAHLRRDREMVEVIDLASANGTYVNGHRAHRARLGPGDVVAVGSTLLRFDGTALEQVEELDGLEFSAHSLTVDVGHGTGRTTLLHDVGFTLPPRSLLAVIGPSGAGKSTLLGALTGQRPAGRGAVHYAGRDLYDAYDELRHRIGLVPQSDLLHAQLTVQRALHYGAALRFPRDTTKAERYARVGEVMSELGLTERADLRIDRLSGGQRKRTSVAIELLTKPSLLFLDEPTSGLDPGLDLQVMQMLRGLADEGCTVVVVTHSVANLDVCDQVMILAPGGYVAYFGPPDEAPGYFGVSDYAQMFLTLETTPGPEWDRQFRLSEYWAASGSQPAHEPSARGKAKPTLSPVLRQPFRSQLATLARRYVAVVSADRAYLAFLAVLPLMLAVLGILVGSDDGLGPGDTPPSGGPPNYQARFLLLVLVLGAAFTGTASSVQELVKERTIYQRERSVGVSRGAYLLSKLLVLGVITATQAAVFAALSMAGRPGPDEALVLGNATIEIIVATTALAVVSMALGLLLSAAIPTTEVALPLLVLVTMVQVVLSGAVPIRYETLLDLLGWLTPAYWAFSAMAATTDLAYLTAEVNPPATWNHLSGTWLLNMAGMVAWFVAYVVLAWLVLRRREPKRT